MVVGEVLDDSEVDKVFRALGDATRRDIVERVLVREHSVSDLARLYPMSFAAVHKHVSVLEDAGLVTRRRQGRESLVSGEVERIRAARAALDGLERLWRERIGQIDEILAEDD